MFLPIVSALALVLLLPLPLVPLPIAWSITEATALAAGLIFSVAFFNSVI